MRLNPIPPHWYFREVAGSYGFTGRYQEAIKLAKRAVQEKPNDLVSHLTLAGIYSLAGREDEARAEAAEVLRINPKYSLKYLAKTLSYKNEVDKELILDALRKAGLPD